MKDMIDETVSFAHKLTEELNSLGIDIWLTYGSSLGAVREGKVIKGDDDIDLMMWDEDFTKLQKLITSNKLSLPKYQFDFRYFENGGRICKISLGNRSLPQGKTFLLEDSKYHCVACGANITEGDHCKDCIEYANQFHIDIFPLKKLNNVKCYCDYAVDFCSKYKLYHYENLKKIKLNGLDFSVSKYVEKTLDFLYNGADGSDNSWRAPIAANAIDWAKTPACFKEDKITGFTEGVFDLFHKGHVRLLERMSNIFDKVYAAVTPDEIVSEYKGAPVIPFEDRVEMLKSCKYVDKVITSCPNSVYSIEWMEENDIDYITAGKNNEDFINKWYKEPARESRLLLLNETPDYHTKDLIKKILV